MDLRSDRRSVAGILLSSVLACSIYLVLRTVGAILLPLSDGLGLQAPQFAQVSRPVLGLCATGNVWLGSLVALVLGGLLAVLVTRLIRSDDVPGAGLMIVNVVLAAVNLLLMVLLIQPFSFMVEPIG